MHKRTFVSVAQVLILDLVQMVLDLLHDLGLVVLDNRVDARTGVQNGSLAEDLNSTAPVKHEVEAAYDHLHQHRDADDHNQREGHKESVEVVVAQSQQHSREDDVPDDVLRHVNELYHLPRRL